MGDRPARGRRVARWRRAPARRGAGVAAGTHARQGDPADAILDVAEESGADLVVVGNKGMTGAKRFLLGSVPNKVSHHAPCSVLIIRTTLGSAAGGASPHAALRRAAPSRSAGRIPWRAEVARGLLHVLARSAPAWGAVPRRRWRCISAAVAATCGTAIDVPSKLLGQAELGDVVAEQRDLRDVAARRAVRPAVRRRRRIARSEPPPGATRSRPLPTFENSREAAVLGRRSDRHHVARGRRGGHLRPGRVAGCRHDGAPCAAANDRVEQLRRARSATAPCDLGVEPLQAER